MGILTDYGQGLAMTIPNEYGLKKQSSKNKGAQDYDSQKPLTKPFSLEQGNSRIQISTLGNPTQHQAYWLLIASDGKKFYRPRTK